MGKYKLILNGKIVEAIQFTGNDKECIEFCSNAIDPDSNKCYLLVADHIGDFDTCNLTDWIVRHGDESYSVVTNEKFLKYYQPITKDLVLRHPLIDDDDWIWHRDQVTDNRYFVKDGKLHCSIIIQVSWLNEDTMVWKDELYLEVWSHVLDEILWTAVKSKLMIERYVIDADIPPMSWIAFKDYRQALEWKTKLDQLIKS